jgi:Tol biopolymer transport system component
VAFLLAEALPAEAAFSGANGLIAFVCPKGPALAGKSNYEICTTTPGGTTKRLTTNSVADINPDISADGSRIYFERVPNCGTGLCPGDIWSMKPNGSGAKQITATKSAEGDPAISASGKQLVYVKGAPGMTAKLVLAKAADGTVLDKLGAGIEPSYSPDGRHVTFAKSDHVWCSGADCIGGYGIYAMKPDGTGKVMLTSTTEFADGSPCDPTDGCPETNGNPDYSPSGSLIAWDIFDSEAQSGYTYRMSAGGSAMTLLTADSAVAGCPQHPAYAPDGTQVVFADGYYCSSGGNPPKIYVQPAGGGAATPLGTGFEPDWGPAP